MIRWEESVWQAAELTNDIAMGRQVKERGEPLQPRRVEDIINRAKARKHNWTGRVRRMSRFELRRAIYLRREVDCLKVFISRAESANDSVQG